MTTDNKIILTKLDNVLKIPRTCLFKENGETFVYSKDKGEIIKQMVVPGAENDQEIVILSGLKEKDKILTSAPKIEKS